MAEHYRNVTNRMRKFLSGATAIALAAALITAPAAAGGSRIGGGGGFHGGGGFNGASATVASVASTAAGVMVSTAVGAVAGVVVMPQRPQLRGPSLGGATCGVVATYDGPQYIWQ